MPKKLTIVSAVALVLLIGVIALAIKLSEKKDPDVPARISVYDKNAEAIYTPTYEDFLAGCVEGLMIKGVEFEPEAVKAIAIAENSQIKYLLKLQSGFENLGADLSVNEYIPYSPKEPSKAAKSAARAALETELTFDGEPFNAPICKISTGRTDECPPYSPSVGLPCDAETPLGSGSTEATIEEVHAALGGGRNMPYNGKEWFHDPVYGDNGTLRFITFGKEKISGETLRTALDLRSTAITVEYSEEKFVFRCKGWGDNRGMSVYAANYLAGRGKTAEEILAIFYPEAKLKSK